MVKRAEIDGRMRLLGSDYRVRAAVDRATPPVMVSPAIVAAPARGVTKVIELRETVQTESGPRVRRATVDGFHPVKAVDAFDLMAVRSRNRDGTAGPLFTVGQVEAGRAYAALHERCASEGLRCSSPEARQGGGGSDLDWIEGVIARSRRLARLQAAIGDSVALSPRGAQAHADRGRRVVRVRDLVDGVCIEGRTLSQLLRAAGWQDNGRTLKLVREALCAALDRMV